MKSILARLLDHPVLRRVRETFDRDPVHAGAAGGPPADAVHYWVPVVVMCVLSALYVYAAVIDLGFSADGAYFFLRILDDKRILVPEPSRIYATLIQQWPVALAVSAGVTNLPVLKGLFHFGLYLPFLISFLICWYASRSLNNDALLLFPLASHLLVSLPAASILAGQSEVLAVIVWPVLFLLLRPRLTRLDGLLLVVLLFAMSRMYETAAVLAGIFLCLLVLRLLVDTRSSRSVLLIATAMAFLIPLTAAYWTLSDFTERSRGDFMGALSTPILRYPLLHPMLTFSCAALFLLALSALTRRLRWMSWLAIVLAGGSIALPAFGRTAGANVSFQMRSLTLTLLPAILCAAVWWYYRRLSLPRSAWIAACAVMSLLAVGYASSWSAWAEFRRSFMAELQSHTGYVSIDDTPLAGNAQRWQWTPSVLSVLWSGNCVRTIIWYKDNLVWPFNPYTQVPLQGYVHYAPPFANAAGGAARCR